MTHPHPKRNFVSRAVLMKFGLKTLNTAGQNSSRAAVSVNTARPINNAYPRPTVNCARPASNVFNRAHSHGNPQLELHEKGIIDNGCSRHMTGNMSYLSNYEEIDGGYVAFGGDPKGGKITGKGKIRTGKLDFEDVYFVKALKFNLFSVTQMCDKKNSILFIDTECVVLSSDFSLLDEVKSCLGNQSNGSVGTKACDNEGKARVETVPGKDYILLPFLTQDPLFSSSSKDSPDAGFKPSREEEKKNDEALENEDSEVLNLEDPRVNQEKDENVNSTNNINTVSSTVNIASIEDNDVDEDI
ncbi:hypothetical protein Tco_1578554 [Tanacetum coccineum]